MRSPEPRSPTGTWSPWSRRDKRRRRMSSSAKLRHASASAYVSSSRPRRRTSTHTRISNSLSEEPASAATNNASTPRDSSASMSALTSARRDGIRGSVGTGAAPWAASAARRVFLHRPRTTTLTTRRSTLRVLLDRGKNHAPRRVDETVWPCTSVEVGQSRGAKPASWAPEESRLERLAACDRGSPSARLTPASHHTAVRR